MANTMRARRRSLSMWRLVPSVCAELGSDSRSITVVVSAFSRQCSVTTVAMRCVSFPPLGGSFDTVNPGTQMPSGGVHSITQAVEEELDALVSETDDDQHREGEILDYVTIDLVELGRRLRRRGNRPARPCVAGGRPLCRRASRSVSDRDRSGSIGCERNAWPRRLR